MHNSKSQKTKSAIKVKSKCKPQHPFFSKFWQNAALKLIAFAAAWKKIPTKNDGKKCDTQKEGDWYIIDTEAKIDGGVCRTSKQKDDA